MPDNNTTTETPQVVGKGSHNNVTVDLVIKPPRRNTKDGDNVPFLTGDFEALSDEQLLAFFGMKEVRKRLISTAHTRCKGFYLEACGGTDESPVWEDDKSLEEYLKYFAEWSARGETLKELQGQLQDLIDRATVLFAEGKTDEAQEIIARDAKEISDAIRSKKRDRSPKAEVA